MDFYDENAPHFDLSKEEICSHQDGEGMLYFAPMVPKMQCIATEVGVTFGISIEEMQGKERYSHIVRVRHIAMYLCRKDSKKSLPQIGKFFGGRDHTTVIYALLKVEIMLEREHGLEMLLMWMRGRYKNFPS